MVKSRNTRTTQTKDVVFSGSLSLRSAGAIRKQLLDAFEEADTIKILFQNVEEVDLSLVQILCAAHRSAIRADKKIKLQNSLPEQYLKVIKDAGITGHIGCSTGERESCLWQD